ncbi:MAG: CCA tRNA nucleotidyltransferase [Brevundimonas sp.]|nr:MAG: CCA tRNA nucleotidyltransferase [Brevundimonas sp.]
MDALEVAGGPDCARFVGGSVRNAVLGQPVDDIDIATTLTPDAVVAALKAAGLRSVPTGIDHGTVTAISDRRPYEITTLRRDVTTDGRNATVAFTTDWAEDAARRDFRLNALYADRAGRIIDPTGAGLDDARAGRIVFVGEAETRIREDYLRILRFFRFYAWYGRGEPDAGAMAACAALKDGMGRLSAERVTKELLKLLAAPDPRSAVAAMERAGVLERVLPGSQGHGRFEALCGLSDDALLRLSALSRPDADSGLATARLRLSNAQRDRLIGALDTEASLDISDRQARALIYRWGGGVVADQVTLAWADAPERGEDATRLLDLAAQWSPPSMPVGGADVRALGLAPGPLTGQALKAFEVGWIADDFPNEGHAERLAAILDELRPQE